MADSLIELHEAILNNNTQLWSSNRAVGHQVKATKKNYGGKPFRNSLPSKVAIDRPFTTR